MGLTFSTPNTTAASYNPIVLWSATPPAAAAAAGSSVMSQASCTTSVNRSCYTSSPVVHTCNMTHLEPNTKYYYKFGDAAVGFTEIFSFTTLEEPGKATSGAATVTAIMYGEVIIVAGYALYFLSHFLSHTFSRTLSLARFLALSLSRQLLAPIFCILLAHRPCSISNCVMMTNMIVLQKVQGLTS